MITKVLVTILVILAALIFVRHKGRGRGVQAQQAEQAANRRTAMFVAVALVALTLVLSAGLYYTHWQQAHEIFRVQVINSHSGAVQHYQVYQSDIDGRRFRTIDGRLINLSDAERMEVEAVPID